MRRHSIQLPRFGILLHVRNFPGQSSLQLSVAIGLALCLSTFTHTVCAKLEALSSPQGAGPNTAATPANLAQTPAVSQTPGTTTPPPSVGLNIVVLDPAHGGVDLGARGTEGIRESEVVLSFTAQIKRALEAQGFQVILTREGNDNPSFDDRSARANAQRGAVFITVHIASTGLAGTVRTYVMPEAPPSVDTTGLIPWDRAQAPFVGLSRKLGDLVQAELAMRFKGSPETTLVAPVRQLRTTAAPAIAVEISSVSVAERAELDRMIPGVAEAIAHGVVDFRPSYVLPVLPGARPAGAQP